MCKRDKCVILAIVSVIIGLIAGILFFNGTIVATAILTPIIFATTFAGIALVLLFIAAAFVIKKEAKECICQFGNCIVAGGAGSLITGLIALIFATDIVVGSVLPAILVGIMTLFFTFTFFNIIALILCLVKSNCKKEYDSCKYNNDYNC